MDADEESTFYRDLENLNISENGVTRTVTRKTVINKYQEVWNEFYDWEQSECLHIIESISLEAHSEADGEAHPHSQRRPLRSDYELPCPTSLLQDQVTLGSMIPCASRSIPLEMVGNA